jgi:hypothetical protein
MLLSCGYLNYPNNFFLSSFVCVCARACVRACACVFGLETSPMMRPKPELGCWLQKKYIHIYIYIYIYIYIAPNIGLTSEACVIECLKLGAGGDFFGVTEESHSSTQ